MKEHTTYSYHIYAIVTFHPRFIVKPLRASFATVARLADSKITCAILLGWPEELGVGEAALCADTNPWYLGEGGE